MTDILNGKAQPPPRFVSARDVAELAGVSRSAVSRAFTPGASVAPETREKIMEAATRLGYQVNDLARGLLANRSRIVGLVATKPEVGFRAVEDVAVDGTRDAAHPPLPAHRGRLGRLVDVTVVCEEQRVLATVGRALVHDQGELLGHVSVPDRAGHACGQP